MPQKIYFDESGFTGNNLLHPQQEYFSYASVATDEDEAKGLVEGLVSKYRVQGDELKGSRLVRFNRGRKLIDEILQYFGDRLKVSISDKKFALACKFHEYIFEPCYSNINSLFYDVGFHRFIANILYLEFKARGAGAEEIFAEFEKLMRLKDDSRLESLFASSVHPENSEIITQVREFAQYRVNDIRNELQTLGNIGAGRWSLDISQTALYTLLAHWGTEHKQICAVCDASKPLEDHQEIFSAMVGKEDQVFVDAFEGRHPITFNLAGPIQFVDSKMSHGVQLADVVAAAAVYAFSDVTDSYAQRWRKIMPNIAHYGSVLPDSDEIDLSRFRVQRNVLLLMELHSRAGRGKCLTDGMAEYFDELTYQLTVNPLRLEWDF